MNIAVICEHAIRGKIKSTTSLFCFIWMVMWLLKWCVFVCVLSRTIFIQFNLLKQ